jgi:hypothetical protein
VTGNGGCREEPRKAYQLSGVIGGYSKLLLESWNRAFSIRSEITQGDVNEALQAGLTFTIM